jgi:ribonuclease HI
MKVPAPHFLLYAEAAQAADFADCEAPRWRFVLRLPGGETSLEAADEEPEAGPERLELLAVVRGLESLEGPSRVTLMTLSRQIRRGLESGLAQWRENDWQWERYGRLTPVKNGDLWRRLDRLLEIHAIECRPAGGAVADDLSNPAPPVASPAARETLVKTKRTRSGRVVRVDAGHEAGKSEFQKSKIETNSKSKTRNSRNDKRTGTKLWSLPAGCRSMVKWVLAFWKRRFAVPVAGRRIESSHDNLSRDNLSHERRSPNRAHFGFAGRNERAARGPADSADRCAGAADDSPRRA